jgi:hypothetical protein
MKSDKTLINHANEILTSAAFALSRVESLDGARDPAASAAAVREARTHFSAFKVCVNTLLARYEERVAYVEKRRRAKLSAGGDA